MTPWPLVSDVTSVILTVKPCGRRADSFKLALNISGYSALGSLLEGERLRSWLPIGRSVGPFDQ